MAGLFDNIIGGIGDAVKSAGDWIGNEAQQFTKTCLVCNKVFSKKRLESNPRWQKRKSCSRSCANTARIRHKRGTFQTCTCGTVFYAMPHTQKNGRGKYCSPQCRNLNQSGAKSYLWKGGITLYNDNLRKSAPYRKWRKTILIRDNFECQVCHASESPEVNHIKPFSLYPELRMSIENGITVCNNCHKNLINKHEKEWESYFYSNFTKRGLIYG